MTVSAFPQNPNQWVEAAKNGIDWIELVDPDQIYEYFNGGLIIMIIKAFFECLAYFGGAYGLFTCFGGILRIRKKQRRSKTSIQQQ